MTLTEVLMVLAIVLILAAFWFSQTNYRHPVMRINCVNNLKQCGLAVRVWEGDNNDRFPTAVSSASGGSKEFITGPNAWRHFQVMSNELSTPKVIFCPQETDRNRFVATNFSFLSNSNLSFFVGVEATESLPQAILFGDHNLTNGTLKNALLEVTTNRPAGWAAKMHRTYGNITFADGSVQQVSTAALSVIISKTGLATNRIQKPILKP